MAEFYLTLSPEEPLQALGVAATASGRPIYLLEKDIWVVWALQGLFESKLGERLVFKAGTSLSKGYDIVQRFSEDVDLTYDVRQIIPELATGELRGALTEIEKRVSFPLQREPLRTCRATRSQQSR